MNIFFDEIHRSIVWIYSHEGNNYTFSLVFHNDDLNAAFKQDISKFLWETSTGTPFEKLSVSPFALLCFSFRFVSFRFVSFRFVCVFFILF